jgi:hypothetical protein
MLNEMAEDLENNIHVQESEVCNHPMFYYPVLKTRFGWARKGKETHWYEIKYQELRND